MGKMKDLAIELQNEQNNQATPDYINNLESNNIRYDSILSGISDILNLYKKVDRTEYTTKDFIGDLEVLVEKYKKVY